MPEHGTPPADYPAREEFVRIFDLTPALICAAAPDGRFLYVNAEWERVLGYSRDELLRSGYLPLIHPDDVQPTIDEVSRQLKGAATAAFVNRYKHKNGGYRRLEWHATPAVDGVLYATALDITERERLSAEALQRQRLLEGLTEGTSDAVYVKDLQGRYVLFNKAASSLVGRPAEEVLGKDDTALFPPEEATALMANDRRVMETGRTATHDEQVTLSPGRKAYLLSTKGPIRDAAGAVTGIFGITRDVTVQTRAVLALQDSERRFKELFEQAPLGIALIDSLNGQIHAVNPMFARIAGRTLDEMRRIDWMSITHPDDVQKDLDNMALLNAGKILGFQMEKRYLHKDGTPVWINMTIAPIAVEEGARPRHLCMVEDITERKKTDAALANLQKLESLGVLAGGIAHDFNNILAALEGSLSLLQSAPPSGAGREELLAESLHACALGKGLARQLLTFAAGGAPVRAVIDLRELLPQAAGFAARGTSARCVFALGDAPLAAEVDKDQVSQVIQNLIINAVQAMPDGGEVTVRAAAAGPAIEVAVSDQGSGIPPENLPRLFDPFFSTKAAGRGLGLSVCHSIMSKHGGSITVESALGTGSTFTLRFPAADPAALPPKPAATPPSCGSGKVLIMDDEPAVARVLKRTLERLGYEAEAAADGQAAIDAYAKARAEGKPFAAVILDLTVPGGMGGLEALGKLKALDPAVKAVVTSGYSEDPVLSDHTAHGFCSILKKPFRLEEVSEALRRALG